MLSPRLPGAIGALAVCLVLSPGLGLAETGFALEKGETAVSCAWLSREKVIVLTETGDGYGIRSIQLSNGEISVIPAPKSFTLLRPSAADISLSLSPDGKWIAGIETPRRYAETRLWKFDGSKLQDVPLRLPQDVIPGCLAWNTARQKLYIAAASYLYPEQGYSLLSIDLVKGQLDGLALKGNLDLVSALVYSEAAAKIVAICSSYRGEYPLQPVAVLLDPKTGQMNLLHSECAGMNVRGLGDGSVLFQKDARLGEGKEAWVLPSGSTTLVPAQSGCDTEALLDSDRSGAWLGWLNNVKADEGTLVFQDVTGKRTMQGPHGCRQFYFSPSDPLVLCVVEHGSRLVVVELPR
jgi:hypothetical protein